MPFSFSLMWVNCQHMLSQLAHHSQFVFVCYAALIAKIAILPSDDPQKHISGLLTVRRWTLTLDISWGHLISSQLESASILTYFIGLVILKWSLALFFLRVIQKQWQQWVVLGVTGIYTLYTVAFIFVMVFACGKPTSSNPLQVSCLNVHQTLGPMNWAAGVFNVLIDWTLTLTAMTVILRVRLDKKSKASVCVLLLFGVLGSVMSIIRLPPYIRLYSAKSPIDFYTNLSKLTIYSVAEYGVGIMAISLAALRPLFVRIKDTLTSQVNGSRSATPYDRPFIGRPMPIKLGSRRSNGYSSLEEGNLAEPIRLKMKHGGVVRSYTPDNMEAGPSNDTISLSFPIQGRRQKGQY